MIKLDMWWHNNLITSAVGFYHFTWRSKKLWSGIYDVCSCSFRIPIIQNAEQDMMRLSTRNSPITIRIHIQIINKFRLVFLNSSSPPSSPNILLCSCAIPIQNMTKEMKINIYHQVSYDICQLRLNTCSLLHRKLSIRFAHTVNISVLHKPLYCIQNQIEQKFKGPLPHQSQT